MVDKLKFWDKNNEATPSNLAPASAVEPKMAKGAILNSQVAAPEALLANQADVNVEISSYQPIQSKQRQLQVKA